MENQTSSKRCLNCQTELQGDYCHVCGQHVTSSRPTIKEFIQEYLNIEFVWDSRFFKTISQIVCKPGHVTNEYVSGKFVSYTHPLKLNMFLLFLFITILLLFNRDLDSSIKKVTRDQVNAPVIHLELLQSDEEYAAQLKASELDTVRLYTALRLADAFPDIITVYEAEETDVKDTLSLWTAVLPHKLIEDEVLVYSEDGYYLFNVSEDISGISPVIKIVEDTWSKMVSITTKYFPVFILLTVPFLAFMVNVIKRKGGHLPFKHFVFSLHYTAFLEMLILVLYLAHLIASPPGWVMEWVMILGSCIYMALAIKKVYETKGWFGAFFQSIIINFGYAIILLTFVFIIFAVSMIVIMINM